MKRILTIADPRAQLEFGAVLMTATPRGSTVYLHGDLGTGKTTLVRGALRGLGYPGVVRSPTYTLVETYSVGGRRIAHFDLYRLDDAQELELLGVRDYFDGTYDCWVEWPRRGAGLLPTPDLDLFLTSADSGRVLEIAASSPVGEQTLRVLP